MKVLIGVDLQNDFCAGGALAVNDGDATVPYFNELRKSLKPDLVVLTQDFHPSDHISFVRNNPGAQLFTVHNGQMMWPAHCEQGTHGAEFHPALERDGTELIIQKGLNRAVDSYSGFGSEGAVTGKCGAEDKNKERTALEAELRARGITKVYVVGLAYDYCVAATAKDAAALGFETIVLKDGCRAVAEESAVKETAAMFAAGVTIQ